MLSTLSKTERIRAPVEVSTLVILKQAIFITLCASVFLLSKGVSADKLSIPPATGTISIPTYNFALDTVNHMNKVKQENEAKEQARLAAIEAAEQAKREEAEKEAAKAAEPVIQPSVTSHVESEDYYLNWIIQHESGGNPNAINPTSGACGLFQRYPCSVPLGNVEAQMADGLAYIARRYGSAEAAYNYWQVHGSY